MTGSPTSKTSIGSVSLARTCHGGAVWALKHGQLVILVSNVTVKESKVKICVFKIFQVPSELLFETDLLGPKRTEFEETNLRWRFMS